MPPNCKCCLFVASLIVAFAVGFILLLAATIPLGSYHVVIDSVSGLDLPAPSKDLVLNPQFNITLRLASSSNPLRHECMDAGTYVQVSYRCVQLASSAAAPHRLCVGPKKSTDVNFVAKGTGVRLPGFLMDSLVADMRSGVEAFKVRLGKSGDSFWVLSCGATRLGDRGAWCDDSWDMCAQHHSTTVNPVILTPPIIIPPEE